MSLAPEIEEQIAAMSDAEPAGALRLRREAPPPEPYPTEALGDLLGGAAMAIQERTQAPIEIGAQSVLATSALAVQSHAKVRLPTGAEKPVSLFLLTVAESGERKSRADDLAGEPVARRERELREASDDERDQYRQTLTSGPKNGRRR